jgi:hypothetical protein
MQTLEQKGKKKPSQCLTMNRRNDLWAKYIQAGYSRKVKNFEQFVLEQHPEVAEIMKQK